MREEFEMVISEPESDKAESSIQTNGASLKSSWCLVGEHNGKRGCVEIKDASKCMSGQVFHNAMLLCLFDSVGY